MSVLMGMDALRLCMGIEPKTYTYAQVRRWMEIMSEEVKRPD